MADLPPTKTFSEINFEDNRPKFDRLNVLVKAFRNKYETEPNFFARAPGRVNLIGEHIDYHGYGVLPMALDQDILIACALDNTGNLTLVNEDPKYPDFHVNLKEFVINDSKPEWYHYVLCGLKGVFEHCKINEPLGMKIMLKGSVPRSAGLSSSSAIVCASALTAAHSNKKSLSKLELASICTWSEKYVGTQGGGMDQSISYLAEPGTAKLINFDPLKATPVTLPEKAVFVVTNSCVELNKAATSHFNSRVLEGQLGVKIIAKHHGLQWQSMKKMKELQEKLNLSYDEMIVNVKKVLHTEPYTREEICQLFSVDDAQFSSEILNEKTKDMQSFKVIDRVLHVLTESQRVLKFKQTCDKKAANAMEVLGDLMNVSHASCRDQYECSCRELDELTEVCRQSGALGSRLTGAGWAGCAVSLVSADCAEEFLGRVKKEFHEARDMKCDSTIMFISSPSGGAEIITN